MHTDDLSPKSVIWKVSILRGLPDLVTLPSTVLSGEYAISRAADFLSCHACTVSIRMYKVSTQCSVLQQMEIPKR